MAPENFDATFLQSVVTQIPLVGSMLDQSIQVMKDDRAVGGNSLDPDLALRRYLENVYGEFVVDNTLTIAGDIIYNGLGQALAVVTTPYSFLTDAKDRLRIPAIDSYVFDLMAYSGIAPAAKSPSQAEKIMQAAYDYAIERQFYFLDKAYQPSSRGITGVPYVGLPMYDIQMELYILKQSGASEEKIEARKKFYYSRFQCSDVKSFTQDMYSFYIENYDVILEAIWADFHDTIYPLTEPEYVVSDGPNGGRIPVGI